jgi:hypothetical protein
MEIPPWHAILRRDDGGRVAEQRRHLIGGFPGLMRLQRDDDIVLRPEFGRIAGRRHFRDLLLIVDQQLQAPAFDSGQMLTAGNDGDIRPAILQENGHIAANRARAKNTDFHVRSNLADGGACFAAAPGSR